MTADIVPLTDLETRIRVQTGRHAAPYGMAELEAVLAARPATPELLMLPRDWMAELLRHVRGLEARLAMLERRGAHGWEDRG